MLADDKASSRRWIALEASAAEVALVGVPAVTAAARHIDVAVNLVQNPLSGADSRTQVIDFKAKPFEVSTGYRTTRMLDIDGQRGESIRASGEFEIGLGGFVHARGMLGFEKYSTTVKLADGTSVVVDALSFGGDDINVFAGVDGPYLIDSNADGKITAADTPNAAARGFSLEDGRFALAILTPRGTAPAGLAGVTWVGLEAGADAIEFVGGPDIDLSARRLSVEANQVFGLPNTVDPARRVIDFRASPQDIVVGTNPTTGASALYRLDVQGDRGNLLRAVGDVEIRVGEFFYVGGSLGFEKSTRDLVLADGSRVSHDVLTVGGTDLQAFAGLNGGPLIDSNQDGTIDSDDTPGPDAVGFSLAGVEFGLVVGTEREVIRSTLDQKLAWRDVALSGTRQVALASGAAGGTTQLIWLSTDGGITWTASSAPTGLAYDSVSISPDGDTVAAVVANGPVVVSRDGGKTWAVSGARSDAYTDVAVLANDRVMAVDSAGRRSLDVLTLSGEFAVGNFISLSGLADQRITYQVTANDLTSDGKGSRFRASSEQALANIAAKLRAAINAASGSNAIAAGSGATITLTARKPVAEGGGWYEFSYAALSRAGRLASVAPASSMTTASLFAITGTWLPGQTIRVSGLAQGEIAYKVVSGDFWPNSATFGLSGDALVQANIAIKLRNLINAMPDGRALASTSGNLLKLDARQPASAGGGWKSIGFAITSGSSGRIVAQATQGSLGVQTDAVGLSGNWVVGDKITISGVTTNPVVYTLVDSDFKVGMDDKGGVATAAQVQENIAKRLFTLFYSDSRYASGAFALGLLTGGSVSFSADAERLAQANRKILTDAAIAKFETDNKLGAKEKATYQKVKDELTKLVTTKPAAAGTVVDPLLSGGVLVLKGKTVDQTFTLTGTTTSQGGRVTVARAADFEPLRGALQVSQSDLAQGFVNAAPAAIRNANWVAVAPYAVNDAAGTSSFIAAAGPQTFGSAPGLLVRANVAANGALQVEEITVSRGLPLNLAWASVSADAKGERLLAAATDGRLYVADTTVPGWRWQAAESARDWTAVAVSADGKQMAAAARGEQGGIWVSSNGGSNWRLVMSSAGQNWTALALTANGGRLIATADGTGIFATNLATADAPLPTRIGIEADAGAARLLGIDAIDIAVTDIGVQVNLPGREGGQVIDFAKSAFDVVTGPDSQRRMSMAGADGELLRVSADVHIAISDYVYLDGTAAFEKRATSVKLADGSTVPVEVLSIGASQVEAFAGLNGPYRVDSNKDGRIDDTDTRNADAIGLSLGNANLALGLFYAEPGATNAKGVSLEGATWTALTARTAAVEVVGVPMLKLSATELFVEVNQVEGLAAGLGADAHVIDFKAMADAGKPVAIRTGPQSTLNLVADGKRGESIRAYGTVAASVGDFLSLSGTLGFEQYRKDVTLSGGDTVRDARLMVITGADISARLATSADADAIGVEMKNLDFGLVLAQSSAIGDSRSWLSVRGQAESVAILGTQSLGVTLSGSNVMFAANIGLGTLADGRANRSTLDWSGARSLSLAAGNSAAAVIDFKGEVLEVGGTMLVKVGDVFQASGSVLVSKQDRDIQVGGRTVAATGFLIGASDVSASVQGIDVQGLDLGLALMTPANAAPGDTRTWLALKAQVDSIALDAADFGLSVNDLTLSATNLGLELNLGFGAEGQAQNETVLELGTSGSGTAAVNHAIAVRTGKQVAGKDETMLLDYSGTGPYVAVTTDAKIAIGQAVLLQGSFAFARLGNRSASVVDKQNVAQTRMMTVSTLSARNVNIQLGAGIGTDDFVGVSLEGGSVGLMLLEDTQGAGSFIGLRAGAERAALDGIDGLTLEGGQLMLAVNTGPGSGALQGSVVDFTAGDLDADGKAGGTTPVRLRGNTVADLDFKTTRLEAGGTLTIALSDPAAGAGAKPIFNASGSIAFRQSGNTLLLAASELTATVNVADMSFGIVDGTMALVMPGEGFALDLKATAGLPVPGLNNVTLYGDVSLALNRTGRAIDESISVGSGSVKVKFDDASDATRFSLSNLDASLDGVLGETLVDLSSGLVSIRKELEAGEKLPVVDKTLDDVLNLSPVVSLGDYIQHYVNSYRDSAWQSPLGLAKPTYGALRIPTIAGLKSYLDQTWAPKAGVSAGLDFALNQDGLAFGFQGKVKLGTDLLPIELDAGFDAIGLKFDARLDVQAKFEADIDLDFALDWSNGFKATFDLNRLGFQGSLTAKDVVLAATLGPVDVSIGRAGKDLGGKDYLRGSLQADIGGAISFTGGEFKLIPGTNNLSVDLPVYASVAGIDLSEGATTIPRVKVGGDPFAGTLTVTTEGMEALTNFSKIRIEDVLFALPDMLDYLKTVDLDKLGLGELPFLDTALSEVLNVADVFKTEVIDKIDFNRPIKRWVALPGETGSATGKARVEAGGNTLIGAPGQFKASMKGHYVTIAGAQRPVIDVAEDGSSLVLGGSFRDAASDLAYEVHKKRERIRTMGEFVDALNRSGLLGNKKATFSPLTQELVVPVTLGATLTPVELPINLALGGGDLSLSTTAVASLGIGIGSTLDLVLNLGGAAPEFAIDNFKLDASLSADVKDLAVNAQLGFLGMTAGGAGTGSGLHIAGRATLELDRTPKQAGGARFKLNELLTEGLTSLQFGITGDAYARMRDLTLKTGGGAGFNIGRGLELGVYVPDFANMAGFKLVFDSGFDITDKADLDKHGLTGKEIVAVVPDLGSIFDVSRLSFADIIGGIRLVGDVIEEAIGDQPFYTEKIPVIERSLSEMLAFGDNFLAKIEAAGATPAGALDEAERLIEEALGLEPSLLDLSIDNDKKLLRIDLNYTLEFAEAFNLKLDLQTLLKLAGDGFELPPAIAEIFDVSGAAAGRLSAGLALSAGIGIALPGAPAGTPFVQLLDYDPVARKGTRLDLTASVQAGGVTLKLKVGQIEAGIFDGTIVLDEDADIKTLAPAALRVALEKGQPKVSAVGAFDIDLPLKLMLKGKPVPLGDLSVYTDPALGSGGVQALFEQIAGVRAAEPSVLKVDLPDFERLLSTDNALLKMLYDPTPVLDGIDLGLGELQSLFEATLDVDLPFIGNGLAEVGTMIGDLRGGLLLDLRNSLLGEDGLPVPGKPVEILQKTLFDAFNGLGILQDTNRDGKVNEADVDIGFYDVSGKRLMTWVKGMPFPKGPVDAIRFDMDLGGRILGGGLDIPLDLNLPGFELKVDGGFALDISWAFDFSFGLSTQEGFYLGVNQDEKVPELRLDLGLFLDGDASDPDKITAFEGRGKLLFFEAGLKDIDHDPNKPGHQPSALTGRLALDVVGDGAGRLTLGKVLSDGLSVLRPSFVVDADLRLGLFLAATGLPKLEADFVFDWGWSLDDPGKVEIPRINIENLRLDLKSTVLDWLLPIADKVAKGVAPFKDIVNALVTPIPGLEQVVKEDPTLRGVISKVVALQDPKAPPINWAFLDAVRFALEMPEAVRTLAAIGSGMPLGSLYNLGRPDFRFQAAKIGTGPSSDASVLDKLTLEVGKLGDKASGGVKTSGSATERSGLVFLPYILDIGNWAKMFSGGNATLFTYELPLLDFGVSFDVQLARIPVPIPPVSWIQIVIGAFGSARGYVDLAFGFDTYGIQKFMETNNLLDIADGFFINDYSLPVLRNGSFVPNTGGKEKPEFGIDLELGLTGGVSLGGVAELGLGGSLTVGIDADLNDIRYANVKRDANGQVTLAEFTGDGKIRASELLTMLMYENLGPLNLFDLDAELGVTGKVYGKVGIPPFQVSAQARLFNLKLLELSYDAPTIQPRFGSVSNGVLTLFSGPRAADRTYIDTTDSGEIWKLSGSGGKVQVEFAGKFYREFTGVKRIEVDLGQGNDSFDASRLSDVTVFAKGGGGDDTIILGQAGGMAFDEEGHNTLKAVESSTAPVTLIGGAGNDSLTGGAGNDLLIAGPGSNTLTGGKGNDVLFALEGSNRLTGGDGVDRYVFIGSLGANRMIEKGDEASILDFSGVIPAELAAFTGPVVGAPTVSIPAGFTATRGGPANLLFRGTPFAFDGPADRQLTVTLRVPDGAVSAKTADRVTVGGSDTERTFSGTLADLNAFFTTPGRITYNYTSKEASRPLSVEVAYGAFINTAQATITASLTLDQVRGWRDVAVAGNRQVAVASPSTALFASSPGGIWLSTDGGTTWTESAAPKDRQYSAVAISADGQKIVAAVTGGGLLASANGGVTWADAGAPTDSYTDVLMLADGRVMASDRAIREQYVNSPTDKGWRNTTGVVRISDAQMRNWRDVSGLPNANWTDVASTADGRVMLAVSGPAEFGTTAPSIWLGRAATAGAAPTWTQATTGLPS
ncbi:MAG: hypothetical protein EBT33_11900, partial [Betaproteobacteria bacterium]|nr:hypothetical protein [Betaproteobacteria bacterium]